jgi:hypothetical protein
MGDTSRRWTRRKITIAALASIGILAMVCTTFAGIVMPFLQGDPGDRAAKSSAATPTSTVPAIVIKRLAVRPVVEAFQAQPGQCDPPPPPLPAAQPQPASDVERKAHYELEPVALQLNLTGAKSIKLPMNEFYTVQIVMAQPSSAAFAQYTTANVGRQVAFVRDGIVLAAPAITQPIDGQSIQLSGELTQATAETIARMLRDGS